jgi:hypothetical protein
MDRHSLRLVRGAAAASVSIFLVAGAAFAASAIVGSPSVGPDFAPAAAARSPLGASKVAEPAETARPAETAETAETPDVDDHSGDQNNQLGDQRDGDHPNFVSGATPKPTDTPEPVQAPDGGGHGNNGSDSPGQGGNG